MSDDNKIITEFIEHARNKERGKLWTLYDENKSRFIKIYEKAQDHKVFNNWLNFLLAAKIYSADEQSITEHKTKAFIHLAMNVDSYLKKNIRFLATSSDEEYKRNLNLCKDISIPCFNITSSFQSTETIIKNFYFCIYASNKIINSYKDHEIFTGNDNTFSSMFEQKIYELPNTMDAFFYDIHKDAKFFDDNVKLGKHNLKYFVDSIEDSLKKIIQLFEAFIRKCNNLFFTLMCRWFEIYLRSLLLIPSKNVLKKLKSFLNQDFDIQSSMDEIIKKDNIFTILSETSSASSYIFNSTYKCFKSYANILGDIGDSNIADNINDKIENLLNFGYGDTDEFAENDYQFSENIKKIIFDRNDDDNNDSPNPRTNKQRVAQLINQTIETFLYYVDSESNAEGTNVE